MNFKPPSESGVTYKNEENIAYYETITPITVLSVLSEKGVPVQSQWRAK